MNTISEPVIYRARFLLPINSPPMEDAALLVNSGRICAVERFNKLRTDHPSVSVVDFGDSIMLPPMVNAHTHLELSSFAEWAVAAGEPDPPQDFVDWVLWLVRVRRKITNEQLQLSLAAGLQTSLLAGTGAIGDILTSLSCLPVYKGSPLFGRVYAEVLGQDPVVVAQRLGDIESVMFQSPAANLNWGLSPHAPYTLSREAAELAFAFASRKNLSSAIHLAESSHEADFMLAGSGAIADKLYSAAGWQMEAPAACSPVQALCQPGRLKQADLVVHGVQVDAADINLLKRYGCALVLCPRSNATLNTGKAPLAAYLAAGVALALGTDSRASSPSLSIWDEVAFARTWFAGAVAPGTLLSIATSGGAKALGLQGRMGQLSPGYEASFQVVNLPELPDLPALEEALCADADRVRVSHLYLASRNVLS